MNNQLSYQRRSKPYVMMPSKRFKGANTLANSNTGYQPLGNSILSKLDLSKSIAETDINIGGIKIPYTIGARHQMQSKATRLFPQVYGKTKTKSYDFPLMLSKWSTSNLDSSWSNPQTAIGAMAQLTQWASPPAYGYLASKDDIFKAALKYSPRLCKSLQWYAMHGREIMNAKIQLTVYTSSTKTGVAIDYIDSIFQGTSIDKKDIPAKDRIVAVTGHKLFDSELVSDASSLQTAATRIKQDYNQSVVTDQTFLDGFIKQQQVALKNAQTELQNYGSDFILNYIHNIKVGYFPLINKIAFVADQPSVQCSLSVKFWYKNNTFEPYLQYLNKSIVPKQIVGSATMIENRSQGFVGSEVLDEQKTQEIVLKASAKKISKLNYAIQNEAQLKAVVASPYKIFHIAYNDWVDIMQTGGSQEDVYAKMRKYNKGLLRSFQQLFNIDPVEFKDQLGMLVKDTAAGSFGKNPDVVHGALTLLVKAYNQKFQGGASDEVTQAIIYALREWLNRNAPSLKLTYGPREVRKGGNYQYNPNRQASSGGQMMINTMSSQADQAMNDVGF